jgi:hypothetical protein
VQKGGEQIGDLLLESGLALVEDIYSVNELAALNHAVSPEFRDLSSLPRAYIKPDKMLELKILGDVLSPRMRQLIFAIMPDPVLHHLHFYEIAAGQSESHIFSDKLAGWHRDPDAEYVATDPTHVSIFIYLCDVGAEDGPFEFALQKPVMPLQSCTPVASMTGPTGTSFVWHRRFYHRAAPNRGSQRRRLLKISVQRNRFDSPRLQKPEFQRVLSTIPAGELWLDMLLGRYQGKPAPKLAPSTCPAWEPFVETMTINLPDDDLRRAFDEERLQEEMTAAHD